MTGDDGYRPELPPIEAYDEEGPDAHQAVRYARAVIDDEWERRQDLGLHGEPEPEPDPPTPSSWAPIDLTTIVGQPLPRPGHLTRDDGPGLLYAGRDHTLFGPSGSGKSWVGLMAVTQALQQPDQRVVIIDCEDSPHGVAERLTQLGVPETTLVDQERLRAVWPNEPVGPNRIGQYPPGAAALTDLVAWHPTLVLIDGVSESMAMEDLESNSAGDVARWFLLISRRFTAAGACVLMIDHTAKATTDGLPTELGSQHKRAGLSGASFFVDAVKEPGRAVGADPVEGLIRLRLMKDRPGWLAGSHRGSGPVVADVTLTSWPDGGITWHIQPPDTAGGPGDRLATEIVAYLRAYGAGPGGEGESVSGICRGLGRSRTDTSVGAKLAAMVQDGDLAVTPGPRGAKLHTVTTTGEARYPTDDATTVDDDVDPF